MISTKENRVKFTSESVMKYTLYYAIYSLHIYTIDLINYITNKNMLNNL